MEQCRPFSFLLIFFVLMWVPVAAGQSTNAKAELGLGVQAYKQAKHDEAIQHFEKAVALDPEYVRARLYLATAYTQQYIPGADTPDNNAIGERAIAQYRAVIDIDSSKPETANAFTPPQLADATAPDSPKLETMHAVKGIAYLDLQMKRFDESKDWYRRAAELDPDDPELYYSIAVIDWTQTYQPRQEERAKLGLQPEASLPARDNKACSMLREKNSAKIQEGIDNLNKALQLRPDYDDAMAYMNLMYRERADVQCDDPAARAADLKTADDWIDKTMAVKKAKTQKWQRLQKQ
jgi:tetratricopeptide (TPR) repeat protein